MTEGVRGDSVKNRMRSNEGALVGVYYLDPNVSWRLMNPMECEEWMCLFNCSYECSVA